LAAYCRLKYPHLVDYLWSSSPPLHYTIDFREYYNTADGRLSDLAGRACQFDARNKTASLYNKLLNSSTREEFTSRLGFSNSTSVESIMSVVIEEIADLVQFYSSSGGADLNEFCRLPTDPTDFAAWFHERVTNPDDRDPLKYNDDSRDSPLADDRSWFWQSCSELGWFRTSADGTFSANFINWTFYRNVCLELFGIREVSLDYQSTMQLRYGEFPLEVTNAIFSFGDIDPWFDPDHVFAFSRDSLRRRSYELRASQCSELTADPKNVDIANETQAIVHLWKDWLNNDCEDLCSHGECVLGVCKCDESYEGRWCGNRTVSDQIWKLGVSLLLAVPTLLVIIAGIAAWIIGRDEVEMTKPRRL
jgi:hypothetical protein